MTKSEREVVFASLDVEADGDNPMTHSMVSFGVAMFKESYGLSRIKPFSTFYVTIKPQQGKCHQESTMRDFWARYPEQWEHVTNNPDEPGVAMEKFATWLETHSSKYVIQWVAGPANFDWMFLKCYYEAYGPLDKPDLGYSCHDLFSMLISHCKENNIDRHSVVRSLSQDNEYTHHALDDATCQGVVYMNMRQKLSQISALRQKYDYL